MPRLFTGVEIPPDIGESLAALQGGLRGGRWIDQANYHVTLRFIGDIDNDVADDIAEELGKIRRPAFDLRFGPLATLGTRKPHSLIAGIEASQPLLELHADHERAVQRAGLDPEGRKFTPHVTLARLRGTQPADTADWLAMRAMTFRPPSFPVNRFVLFSARASTGGGPYVVEETYDLA